MTITTESRAIQISPEVPDLFVTTTNITKWKHKHDLEAFVASSVGVPKWSGVRRTDLQEFWSFLPKHIQECFPDTERGWLEEDGRFIDRILEVQLEGNVFSCIGGSFYPIPSDPFLKVVNFLNQERGLKQESIIEGISFRRAISYIWALTRLSGVYADGDQTRIAADALSQAYVQDIPISHSSELGKMTLNELASKGVIYASLFPLFSDTWAGVENLMAANLLLAFQIKGVGAGMTLCAVSTVWVADKLFASIKHIEQYDTLAGAKIQTEAPDDINSG